jgi:hypothetical protein
MTDIVEELNIAARHEDASEKVIHLLSEAAGTIDHYRMWLREANTPVATVTNNNQPGTSHIVETAPNVTLDIGTKLYLHADEDPTVPDKLFETEETMRKVGER